MSFPPFLFLACLHFSLTSLVSVHIQVLVVALCFVLGVHYSLFAYSQEYATRYSAFIGQGEETVALRYYWIHIPISPSSVVIDQKRLQL